MNTLTGNEDVDVKIINSFNLEDLRRVCQMNQYTANLCENHITLKSRIKQTKQKVEHVLELINSRVSGVILQPNDETETFQSFHDLMNKINITEPASEDDPNDLHPSIIFNDFTVFNITIYKNLKNYKFVYQLGDLDLYGDSMSIDGTTFDGNENQLKEFLLHIYYNKLILI
jgi:hypothetical protein